MSAADQELVYALARVLGRERWIRDLPDAREGQLREADSIAIVVGLLAEHEPELVAAARDRVAGRR